MVLAEKLQEGQRLNVDSVRSLQRKCSMGPVPHSGHWCE